MRVLFAIGSLMGLVAWLLLPNIAGWRGVISRLPLRRKNRPANCDGSFAAISKTSAPILLCGAKMASMPPEKLARYVETENLDAMHQELRAGRPVILLLSHIGNWELFAQLVPHYAKLRQDWNGLSKTGKPLYRPGRQPETGEHRRRALRSGRRISQADRIAAFRRADWDSWRSTCGRPWRLDAVLRQTCLDFPAPGFAGQKNRRGGHRRGRSHRRAGALADGFHSAPRFAPATRSTRSP